MTDVLISSSTLILILCVLRQAFKGKIKAKLQYALWGLVALRLCLPFSIEPFLKLADMEPILESPYSVLSIAQEVKEQTIDGTDLQPIVDNVTKGYVYTDPDTDSMLVKAASIDWELVIMIVWMVGAVVMAAIMLRNYLRFSKTLLAERKMLCPGGTNGFQYPVYVVNGLKSPCLFAAPGYETAIYVTPGVAADTRKLRHVRVHEEVHGRHNDLRWARLRTTLLCFYWINPFVWLAAILCKQDCELACDEAAVELLGEEERFAYGRTLVSLIAVKTSPADVLELATTMTGSGRSIRERIQMLTARKKGVVLATVVLAVAVAASVLFTFTRKEEASGEGNEFAEISNTEEDVFILDGDPDAALTAGDGDIDMEDTQFVAMPAACSTEMTLGADGPILDYASEERVIFHGYFGLFVYDMQNQVLMRSLDLESLGCADTQGDNACEVRVSKDGSLVYLHAAAQDYSFIYHVNAGELVTVEEHQSLKYVELYDGVEPLTFEEMSEGNLAITSAKMEDGTKVYLTWEDYVLGDLRIRTDKGLYPYMFYPIKEAPSAEISVNDDALVPNFNYYLLFDGKEYAYEGVFNTFMSVQAYRTGVSGDVVCVQLDEEDLAGVTIENARVYDYWIDKEGIVKTWNRFVYEPLENVTVAPTAVTFTMGMNMAAALSSTYDPEGLFRGMAVECDLSDGNTAVYYFVLHADYHVIE